MDFREYLHNLATDKTKGLIPGLVKSLLFILSLVYGLAVKSLMSCSGFRKVRLACRVVSVGNITLGGTGKTVMVELIARYLKEHGHKVAILSRGYKKPGLGSVKSFPSYETMGDEPFMMREKLQDVPVLVDPDRVRSAKKAVFEYAVDTVILDDGLQQWRIEKDLEVVMLDGINFLGNRRCLPRGVLRQPVSTLKNADIFILTNPRNADLKEKREFLARLNPAALILEAEHSAKGIFCLSRRNELLGVDFFKGKAAALFCGVGNPDSFRVLAQKMAITEGLFFEFPDHYRFAEEDLEIMVQEAREKDIQFLLTTEKDAVRIPLSARKRFGENIFVLAIELKLKDEKQGFFNRLLRIYSA